jgi:aspartyl/asparaginyl beta-hydroxylase (cupin superfamily)
MKKVVRNLIGAAVVLGLGLTFIPIVTILFLCTGLIDVMRNTRRDSMVFQRYFLGNGIPTWLLSPFNLLIDLLCYRNKGVYAIGDLPPEWREEVESILDTFRNRKEEIVADIDRVFEAGRRGMYVFKWYGKENPHNIAEFKRDFSYVKTIAVSVFSRRESTSFHFGPLRLTLRVLYNLSPLRSDDIFIECGNRKHYWHDDPLYIFDDTLIHRSVNQYDARRYCVFMDIVRPTPFPRLLSALLSAVSFAVEKINTIFYKNWKMLRPAPKPTPPPAGGPHPAPRQSDQ